VFFTPVRDGQAADEQSTANLDCDELYYVAVTAVNSRGPERVHKGGERASP